MISGSVCPCSFYLLQSFSVVELADDQFHFEIGIQIFEHFPNHDDRESFFQELILSHLHESLHGWALPVYYILVVP